MYVAKLWGFSLVFLGLGTECVCACFLKLVGVQLVSLFDTLKLKYCFMVPSTSAIFVFGPIKIHREIP